MRKTVLVFLCISICVAALFAGDSDTTYGRIRIKKKTTSAGGGGSGTSDDDDFLSSCTKSCISEVFDGCLDALLNSRGETRFVYNDDPSGNPVPRKKKRVVEQEVEPCDYSMSPFHFSGGVGMGGVLYSNGIAHGFVVGGNTGCTWFPDTLFGVRLTLEPVAAFDNILVDMEKDVYVDGLLAGTTVFSGERANEFILPIMANILFVPSTPSRTLYLAFGGGLCYKQEVATGKQILNGNVSNRTVTFNQWCRAIHFGLGFFMQFSRNYGILEFGYTLMSNENNRRFETPGDNARYGHMPTISFSISTP